MDLGNVFAIGYLLLNVAAWIGVGVLLWRATRRWRDSDATPAARNASERLSEGGRHHPA